MSLMLPIPTRQLAPRPLTWRGTAGKHSQQLQRRRLSGNKLSHSNQHTQKRTRAIPPWARGKDEDLGTTDCPQKARGLGTQEAGAGLRLVLGARTPGVHDNHHSGIPEVRVHLDLSTWQDAHGGAWQGLQESNQTVCSSSGPFCQLPGAWLPVCRPNLTSRQNEHALGWPGCTSFSTGD